MYKLEISGELAKACNALLEIAGVSARLSRQAYNIKWDQVTARVVIALPLSPLAFSKVLYMFQDLYLQYDARFA